MSFFLKLRTQNWRNFRYIEVDLTERTFIIGPNASGKSNILDIFRFLRDLTPERNGGLASAVALRGGISQVRCLHGRVPSHVAIDVLIQIGDDQWRYFLRFNQKKGQLQPRVQDEIVEKNNQEILRRDVDQEASEDDERLTQTHLQQVTLNGRFREVSKFFSSIEYSHVVPQIIRDPRRQLSDDVGDPFGGDLLARMHQTAKRTREARLRRLSDAISKAVPQFRELHFETDNAGRPHLSAEYSHWRRNPTHQREESFSDGTLRLLGLLWAMSEKGGPLLLEEPELSLHDAVVKQIPGMLSKMQRLSGRQVFVTTHSAALLSDSGIGPKEVQIIDVTDNGSVVQTAADDEQIRSLYNSGLTMADVALPKAAPKNIEQLTLF